MERPIWEFLIEGKESENSNYIIISKLKIKKYCPGYLSKILKNIQWLGNMAAIIAIEITFFQESINQDIDGVSKIQSGMNTLRAIGNRSSGFYPSFISHGHYKAS